MSITAPLTNQILQKSDSLLPSTKAAQVKGNARVLRDIRKTQSELVDNIRSQLPSLSHQWCLEPSLKKGASCGLTPLPIQDHGFTLHKSAFRDAVCLRCDWELKQLTSHCLCGKPLNVEHILSCPTGGFPIICHNEIRDITVSLMTEVCHSVSVEPLLQPLTGEQLSTKSALTTDEDRADIQARGFWRDGSNRHSLMSRFSTRMCA